MMRCAPPLRITEVPGIGATRRAAGLADLFMPLDDLLASGGDPRLTLDRAYGVNEYGCGPAPAPETLCFSSSTASPISKRAYERAGRAREELMRSAQVLGLEQAFDARIEAMRDELRAHLGLSAAEVDVVFSPSGTDAQLHALALAHRALGAKLTSIVVGADQTGSGTAFTARGRHFSAMTASGRAVLRDTPIAGLAAEGVMLPLLAEGREIGPEAGVDAAVLAAVEQVVARGSAALLQIMASSKLGWCAPGEACLAQIAARWPDAVQVVVDACQMRLGHRRLRAHLDRGRMVLISGSKFYGGPAFSGALLVPAALSRGLEAGQEVAAGLADYAGRSDWPMAWRRQRARFESRPNFGQWLRWEAALEEIAAYHQVPQGFRALALRELGQVIESLIALSPSLRFVSRGAAALRQDDEFAETTIFPFLVCRDGVPLPADDCRLLYRALRRDLGDDLAGGAADQEIASQRCLLGQPVRIEHGAGRATAALRFCVGARQVTQSWSPVPGVARRNLEREIDRIATVVAKIELLAGRIDRLESLGSCMMESRPLELSKDAWAGCADRIGMARLAKMAFDGKNLRPLWADLVAKLLNGTAEAGEAIDLSLIAQLLGDKEAGLAIQQEILREHRLFRPPCVSNPPRLRVLALAAATDMGSNTPIEFLLENSGIELMMLYVTAASGLPAPLPEHDIAIVIASDSEDCRDALAKVDAIAARWPRPLLNPPKRICNIDRDKLHRLLGGIDGLTIPATTGARRAQLSDAARSAAALAEIDAGLSFPVIVRPRGSHAGAGLAKIDDGAAMLAYLDGRKEQEFFVSRFVDYASEDGLFRKYRIVLVDGTPFACHMAIADRWDIWYLNAGMNRSAEKRLEEATFMRTFDIGFGRRHQSALAALAARIGLDYFVIDCAETRDGALLIFEADNTAVVHNMDPAEVFPYKGPQMRKVFDAFAAMLERRVAQAREQAA